MLIVNMQKIQNHICRKCHMCTLFCTSIQYVKKISTKPDYCVDFHTELPQDLLLFSGGSPAKKDKNQN